MSQFCDSYSHKSTQSRDLPIIKDTYLEFHLDQWQIYLGETSIKRFVVFDRDRFMVSANVANIHAQKFLTDAYHGQKKSRKKPYYFSLIFYNAKKIQFSVGLYSRNSWLKLQQLLAEGFPTTFSCIGAASELFQDCLTHCMLIISRAAPKILIVIHSTVKVCLVVKIHNIL